MGSSCSASSGRRASWAVTNVPGLYRALTNRALQAMFLRAGREDRHAFFAALNDYYGDATLFEPKLIQLYDDALPKIDRAPQ